MKRFLAILRGGGKLVVILATTAGLVLLMAVLAGVFKEKVPSEGGQPAKQEAIPDHLGEVTLVELPRYETSVGTIKAIHESSVASKLLARVTEVNVKAGQAVNEGDILIRLDDADLRSRLQQAQSAVAGAQAALERATADYDRARNLVSSGAITQAEFDQLVAAVKTGRANLEQSQHAVSEAQVVLDYATIRSPLTGVVVDKRVEPGDTAAPGQVLVTLYQPDRLQLVASVRESLASKLKVGDQLPASIDALGIQCHATISEIVPESESASRSFTVKVTGPCPPGAISGMFGRISVPLGEEEVVVVPSDAVQQVGQLKLVDVVADGETHRRNVRLGRQLDNQYEVLAGLHPGEQVVLHSSSALDVPR